MNTIIAVALGGSIGAVIRHYTILLFTFPFGTLFVNIVGSFLMGILIETLALKFNLSLEVRAFIATGFLGAFTTFSTFSLDVFKLVETNQYMQAGLYVFASVLFSITAIFAAVYITRGVLG